MHGYFEELVDFLRRIGPTLTRLQRYEVLFSDPTRVSVALYKVFTEFLSFCHTTRNVFKHQGNRSKFSFKTVSSRLLKDNVWKSFKTSASNKVALIDSLCRETEREAALAAAEDHAKNTGMLKERLLQQDLVRDEKREAYLFHCLCAWLAPLPTIDDFEAIRDSQHGGSCVWIENHPAASPFLSPEFQQPTMLWISGRPGCGKTYVSAHIIDILQKRYRAAYFFCKVQTEGKRTALSVFRTWAWQLLQTIPREKAKRASTAYENGEPLRIENAIKLIK